MQVNRPLEAEVRRRVRQGWVLNHQTEHTASLSRRGKGRSCLLVIVLLMLGLVPGIVYLMWPRRDESILLTRLDSQTTEVVGEDWSMNGWFRELSPTTQILVLGGIFAVFALLIMITD